MRKRILVSAASALSIFSGGTVLFATPRNAATASAECCPQSAVKEAVSELGDICGGGGGSAQLECSNGTWELTNVSCNAS